MDEPDSEERPQQDPSEVNLFDRPGTRWWRRSTPAQQPATVAHHLPDRPQRSRGVPTVEALVLVGSASLLTLPAVIVTNEGMPALELTIGVAVVAALLVASRRAAVGPDWVGVRRYGRWTVLPAAELTLLVVEAADHGDRLALHHRSGARIVLRKAEVAGLLPVLRPVLGTSAAHAASLSTSSSDICPVIHARSDWGRRDGQRQ